MSKSFGNVINPEDVSKNYGIDTARLFLLSVASPDKDLNWSEQGIEGSFRFVKKVFSYFENFKTRKADEKTESKLNKTIKEVETDIENFNYNLAVIKIRELFNSLPEKTSKDVLEKFLKILNPFCPHITEELWEKLGHKKFICLEKWPEADEGKIDEKFEKQERAVEKLIGDINHVLRLVSEKDKEMKKVYVYVLPSEVEIYSGVIENIKKRVGLEAFVYSVSDKNKYDPENKSKKVKPGKPGIYLE
jgi:leucyl-tRNA synthetase